MRKKILVSVCVLVCALLCSCAGAQETQNEKDNGSINDNNVLLSDTEPVQTDDADSQVAADDIGTIPASAEDDKIVTTTPMRDRPDGKEVTIFADNTFDCDYSDYKEIGYDFWDLHRSVMAPKDWNGFRFAPKCDYGGEQFENGLTGIPVYDGSLPVEIDRMHKHDDYTDYFANKPMEKSTFFFAESPWMHAQDFIAENITKYDHETYIDKKGRSIQVYYLDGLPKYACYDDFFNLCVWFNLKSEEQIPTVVNMINSIEVSLSRDAEFALYTAEKLGYTIIPPEE